MVSYMCVYLLYRAVFNSNYKLMQSEDEEHTLIRRAYEYIYRNYATCGHADDK